jgi:hypothetical protein
MPTIEQLIEVIELDDEMSEREIAFLVKNISHIRTEFTKRFHKDIVINI